MISRRMLLAGLLATGATLARTGAAADDREAKVQRGLGELERQHGGRLGVAILDTGRNKLTAHRGDERFPLCSTHKFLSAALVLARVDRREERLDRRIAYGRDALVA